MKKEDVKNEKLEQELNDIELDQAAGGGDGRMYVVPGIGPKQQIVV